MDNRPDAVTPFCNCTEQADCEFGLDGRRFEMCRGTGPQRRREDYRDAVRGERKRVKLPDRQTRPLDDENLTAEQIDELYGCSACGQSQKR